MKKLVLIAGAAAALSSCGTMTGDRIASGAMIGGGTGAVLGGVGAVPGAIVGGAVGAFTTSDQVDLGRPPWRDGRD